MKSIGLKSVIMGTVCILLLSITGCNRNTYRLAKTHPGLQQICDLNHGCFMVEVECEKYDNTGNTILRNETVWTVRTDDYTGIGFGPNGLDAAIKDWFEMKAFIDKLRQPSKDVYPHSKPCDSTCDQ